MANKEVLEQQFEAARKQIRQQKTMREGGAGAEGQYAQSYQNLVREGAASQIRAKYRER